MRAGSESVRGSGNKQTESLTLCQSLLLRRIVSHLRVAMITGRQANNRGSQVVSHIGGGKDGDNGCDRCRCCRGRETNTRTDSRSLGLTAPPDGMSQSESEWEVVSVLHQNSTDIVIKSF